MTTSGDELSPPYVGTWGSPQCAVAAGAQVWHTFDQKVPLRAAKRRKRLNRRIHVPEGADLAKVAQESRYVGSPEHKDSPSFAGSPRPRADASICDRRLERDEIDGWLRNAIQRGAVGEYWEGAFPRYVRYKHEGTVYEARLMNSGTGEYKGYPLSVDEWPPGLNAIYE